MQLVPRFLLVHRRLLLAVLVGVLVWSTLSALTAEPPGVRVPVAARDLASGHRPTPDDVVFVEFSPDSVPEGVLTHPEVLEGMVGGPMRKGEVFTDRRAVDRLSLTKGHSLAAVEVSPATAEILRVGDRVDVVASSGDGTSGRTELVRAARVVSVHRNESSGTATVAVEVRTKVARLIAAVSASALVNVIHSAVP